MNKPMTSRRLPASWCMLRITNMLTCWIWTMAFRRLDVSCSALLILRRPLPLRGRKRPNQIKSALRPTIASDIGLESQHCQQVFRILLSPFPPVDAPIVGLGALSLAPWWTTATDLISGASLNQRSSPCSHTQAAIDARTKPLSPFKVLTAPPRLPTVLTILAEWPYLGSCPVVFRSWSASSRLVQRSVLR